MTDEEKKASWQGKGIYITWSDGTRDFFPAKSAEHYKALKAFYNLDRQKTGRKQN